MARAFREDLIARVRDTATDAKVLDVGGWARPFGLATHVVDVMPYVTRGISAEASEGICERFTEESWYQLDVTEPSLRLPFPDDYFDFATCMHTAEDLHEVRPLLRELSRVAKAGYIETPSRLAEQTIGVADRTSSRIGYNHHKWIVDKIGEGIVLFDKAESLFQPRSHCAIPLLVYERHASDPNMRYFWEGSVQFSLCLEPVECRDRARSFREGLGISRFDEALDWVLRTRRAVRDSIDLRFRGPRGQSSGGLLDPGAAKP